MVVREERYRRIINWLENEISLNISELKERLQVSTMTIWRDLEYLEEKGLIQRVHGGALKINGDKDPEPFFDAKQQLFNRTKARYCSLCCQQFYPRRSNHHPGRRHNRCGDGTLSEPIESNHHDEWFRYSTSGLKEVTRAQRDVLWRHHARKVPYFCGTASRRVFC